MMLVARLVVVATPVSILKKVNKKASQLAQTSCANRVYVYFNFVNIKNQNVLLYPSSVYLHIDEKIENFILNKTVLAFLCEN